jgi:phosphoglycolate phosphatase-like HAD superfamily hydrolase
MNGRGRGSLERLVLFDIDGTILTSGGAAGRAFRRALEEVFGTSGPTNGYSFAGRTDPRIARDLLSMAGLDSATIESRLPQVWERYTGHLRREFTTMRPRVFPGVIELLDRVEEARDSAVLGLLTGNVEEGARLKLESAGIARERFVVGAFGSDHHDRAELPAVAVQRAEEIVGHRFIGKAVVIIGDTPADISCGAHLGVRTIAVATGTYSAAQLKECRPDFLFESLVEVDSVLSAIFA